mmetsp:Transcript_63326/g.169290  ORF Transcript_63326/g.169290 Transcript_63326/m.169290 type:complete len:422 (-) Transcript_63326:375-1640(-)
MTGRICGLCSVRATRLDTTNHSGLSFWTINRTHGFGWATTYMLMLGGQDHSCCRPSDKLCYQISASMMCFSFPGMHHGWVNFINFKKPIQVTLASANRAFPSWEPGTTTTSASTTATAHTRFAASRSSSSSTSSTSRCVGVALLDGRYHKTPYWSWPFRFTSRADDADFLGEEQWAWLDRTLRGSECEVNLIVSGLQVLPEGRWQGENWDRFPRARQRLLDVVLSSGARSPIILSGDVHFAELSQVSCRPRGADGSFKKVDLWEVTTSGMTHSWETAHKSMMPLFRLFMAAAPNRAQRGFPFTGLNVAVMDLKFSQSPDEPPRIESAILSVDGGRHLVTQLEGPRLPASSLGPWECEPALGKPSLLVIMATEFLFFVVVGSVMTLMFAAFTSPIWGVVLLAYYLAHRLRGARGGSGRLKQC